MPVCDVIVIGAGPAGAAAALVAAQGGLRVALIDKARFPRDKLCGGGISGRAARILAQVFGPLPEPLMLRVDRIRLRHRGVTLAEQPCVPLASTMRLDLDAELHARAIAAGAQDWTGRRITALDPESGQITLSCQTQLTAAVLIGADGVHSRLARALHGAPPRGLAFAIEQEAPPRPGPPVLEVDLDATPWGYAWAFAKRGGTTLGIGGLHSTGQDLPRAFRHWQVQNGHPPGPRIQGHHLPFGTLVDPPGQGRCLLVGDAAGLVDPLTGEGIAWAVTSGALAGAAAVRALAAGAPGAALRHYAAALAPVQAEIRRARILRALIYARPLRPLARWLIAQGPVQDRFIAILQGERDWAELRAGRILRLVMRLALRRA